MNHQRPASLGHVTRPRHAFPGGNSPSPETLASVRHDLDQAEKIGYAPSTVFTAAARLGLSWVPDQEREPGRGWMLMGAVDKCRHGSVVPDHRSNGWAVISNYCTATFPNAGNSSQWRAMAWALRMQRQGLGGTWPASHSQATSVEPVSSHENHRR